MMINKCTIEAGGVVSATPQILSCLVLVAPQKLWPVWILNGQNLSLKAHLINF